MPRDSSSKAAPEPLLSEKGQARGEPAIGHLQSHEWAALSDRDIELDLWLQTVATLIPIELG